MGRGRAKAKLAAQAVPQVRIPALMGLTFEEGLAVAGPLGLAFVGPGGESPVAMPGRIGAQAPSAGSLAPTGSVITIWTVGGDDDALAAATS